MPRLNLILPRFFFSSLSHLQSWSADTFYVEALTLLDPVSVNQAQFLFHFLAVQVGIFYDWEFCALSILGMYLPITASKNAINF